MDISELDSEDLLSIAENPNADHKDLVDIIQLIESGGLKGDAWIGNLSFALLQHPKLSESDIPSSWLSNEFMQKSSLTFAKTPAWILTKICDENPDYLYSYGDCSLYMIDLVSHPNLPEEVRRQLLRKYPQLKEGHTSFWFSIDYTNSDKIQIKSIIDEIVSQNTDFFYEDTWMVSFGAYVELVCPLILVKQNSEILGNRIMVALSKAGYHVNSWEYDDVD